MNRAPGPLSPISTGGGSDWSGLNKYQGSEANSPYSANPGSRGQLISPPASTDSNSMMNGGYQQGPPGGPNAPSPPASIARSSIPTSLYGGSQVGGQSGGRERRDEQFEGVLSEHYVALKRFLAAALRDEKGNPRPNKARDKLLRLSPVQFQELSTDVFDELLRRQAASRRPPSNAPGMNDPGVPAYLLPKDTFHPKRNQARQKLSTLPPPRFRDLATDVFYELERRFPHFATGEMNRSNNGTPMMGSGFRPDNRRRPSEASSMSAYNNRSDSRTGSMRSNMPMNSPGMPPDNFGRPLPRQFQSQTLVPNKSTMVEDDDDDESALGTNSATVTSEEDKKRLEDYEKEVAELKEKVDGLQETLRKKDEDLDTAEEKVRTIESNASAEKKELSDLRADLEGKLADAQNLNESLQSELDRLRNDQADTENDLRQQLEQLQISGGGGAGNEQLELENQQLREELRQQQDISEDVRQEAQTLLREMKILADGKGSSWDREQELLEQVNRLEHEVEDWRNRYAKTKSQLRSVRASSIGLTIQPPYQQENAHHSPEGLVRDVNVTKFQIAIDELLRIARSNTPEKTIEFMKSVIKAVLRITKDIEESIPGGKLNDDQMKLKGRVSATCNNLIIACKNYVEAKGLSPVSLLDAAASHITTSVVELVKTVKIRPTPAGELEDDDDTTLPIQGLSMGGYPVAPHSKKESVGKLQPFKGVRDSANSSNYSPIASARTSNIEHGRTNSQAQEHWRQQSVSGNGNGGLGLGLQVNGMNKSAPAVQAQQNGGADDIDQLRMYIEDQTTTLVSTIQTLVSTVRTPLPSPPTISTSLSQMAAISHTIINAIDRSMTSNPELRQQADEIVNRLAKAREQVLDRLDEAGQMPEDGPMGEDEERGWVGWCKGLPPLAFEVARETKELVGVVEGLAGEDDFA